MAVMQKTGTQGKDPAQQTQKSALTLRDRFAGRVLKEFSGSGDGKLIPTTPYHIQLAYGYFITIEKALANAEEARSKKNAANKDHKYDNNLPYTWANVNMEDLAWNLANYIKIGLDMTQPNHLYPIPYKNNKTGKYDITLMVGYNGIQYVAEKYAVENPTSVTTELVYDTDVFRPIKKGIGQSVDSYEFQITNPFDRGRVVGGFGYIEYKDPLKNKLIIMPLKEILKRKPKFASPEFWGGTKKEWQNGKPVDVDVEGWIEQMYLKTLKREVYSAKHVPLDPKKIDDAYRSLQIQEARSAEVVAQLEVDENANALLIDTDTEPTDSNAELIDTSAGLVDINTGEIIDAEPPIDNLFTSEPPANTVEATVPGVDF